MERWRKPPRILGIEDDPSFVTDEADGRTFAGVSFITDAETTERLRLGYICPKCFELHERPFPERCPTCGLGAHEQREWFRRFFKGVELVGSRISISDELERLKEERL